MPAQVLVAAQFDKEASQTRDYCVAKYATHRAARLDPSLRKERLLGMTVKLSYYPDPAQFAVLAPSTIDLRFSRWVHVGRNAGARERRAGAGRLPENRVLGLSRSLHSGRGADCDWHYRKQGRS